MLEKITNRKQKKAIKKIEEAIEYEKGRRDYYVTELRLGARYEEAKVTVSMIEYHNNRIGALQGALRIIKNV